MSTGDPFLGIPPLTEYRHPNPDQELQRQHGLTGDELLDADLLRKLESRWRDHHLPLLDKLRPGVSEDRIDALTAPLGLQLPLEAKRWWGWHDGGDVGPLASDRYLGPGFEFLPLAEAIERCVWWRQLAVETARDIDSTDAASDPHFWWRASWFPVTERNGALACDCSVAADTPTPIYCPDSHDVVGRTEPGTRSLRQLVAWWAEAFDTGVWKYDAESRQWNYQWELLDPIRARLV